MMSALVQREPAVFLAAVARTCTLDTNRGETMIRLKTAREVQQTPASAPGSREATAGGSGPGTSGTAAAGGTDAAAAPAAAATQPAGAAAAAATPSKPAEQRDSAAGDKQTPAPKSAAKPHKKLVPANFVEVIDALLDVVMSYNGAASCQQPQSQTAAASTAEPAAMELDQQSPRQQAQPAAQPQPARAPLPAAATTAAGGDTAPVPADLLLRKLNPLAREVGLQAMVLRLLSDYCLLYNNTVGLLLKRDNEVGSSGEQRGAHTHSTPAASAAATTPAPSAAADGRTLHRRHSSRHKEHSSTGGSGQHHHAESHKAGVVLKHIMHVQLVDQPPARGGSSPNGSSVSGNASSLLQAVCIRSAEGRRRILHELVATLNNSIQGSHGGKQQLAAAAASNGPLPATVSACSV